MDFLNIISLDINLKNLTLNKVQVDSLMREMTETQNALLYEIIQQNKKIIALLENLTNA